MNHIGVAHNYIKYILYNILYLSLIMILYTEHEQVFNLNKTGQIANRRYYFTEFDTIYITKIVKAEGNDY